MGTCRDTAGASRHNQRYAGGPWPAGDLQRLSFSCYGPRFDLQGWGEDCTLRQVFTIPVQ
ncbi:MAG: hypothetical protein ABFR50_05265 [Candidatus Fermentibacteria bacterium]